MCRLNITVANQVKGKQIFTIPQNVRVRKRSHFWSSRAFTVPAKCILLLVDCLLPGYARYIKRLQRPGRTFVFPLRKPFFPIRYPLLESGTQFCIKINH